jgi:hypothetical protein
MSAKPIAARSAMAWNRAAPWGACRVQKASDWEIRPAARMASSATCSSDRARAAMTMPRPCSTATPWSTARTTRAGTGRLPMATSRPAEPPRTSLRRWGRVDKVGSSRRTCHAFLAFGARRWAAPDKPVKDSQIASRVAAGTAARTRHRTRHETWYPSSSTAVAITRLSEVDLYAADAKAPYTPRSRKERETARRGTREPDSRLW